MDNSIDLGNYGEEVASKYLTEKGHKIIKRNWQSGHREIDIITIFKGQLVFTEVKTRRKNNLQQPQEAVTLAKQKLIIEAANTFILLNNIDKDVRFDVISVIFTGNNYEIEHIEDAFYPKVK